MKRKILIGLGIILTFGFTSANAQRQHPNCNNENRGPRQEVRAYIMKNVVPVMKIQRSELDKDFSDAEKASIEELRTELKGLRQQQRGKSKSLRGAGERPSVEQRKEMRGMRNQMHELMNEAAVISEDYDVEITRLLDEIREEAEQWKTDIHLIMEKSGMNPEKRHRKMDKRSHSRGQQRGGMNDPSLRRIFTPEGFLLWDPSAPLEFGPDQNANKLKVNIFPNPASNNFQLAVDMTEELPIEIIIIDKDGNTINEFSETSAGPGLYTKIFSTEGFKSGLYFVKVKTGPDTSINRLIIQ